jgi:sugar transferase (PEP-CTERM/EpsH1 system associated)
MKLLFLTPQRPYPPHQGTTIRNFNLIKELARRHQIWLLTFLEPDQPTDHGPLIGLCQAVETVPAPTRSTATRLRQMLGTNRPDMGWRLWSTEFEARLQARLQTTGIDVVHIEGIEMAPYLPTIRQFAPQARIIYDDHNAEWMLQQRNFSVDIKNPRRWIAAAYSLVQTLRLKRYERWVCQQADGVVVCSRADQQAIEQLDASLKITLVSNGVDLETYANYSGQVIPFDLVFTGKMDYRPNIDAMLWFADQVLPRILAERPQTTLGIVGQRPHSRLDRLKASPAITITGYVDDILPYIAGAGVYIAPFRVGGGTRLKLLEAMAMRKPIVATTVGAEGYPVSAGREMILVDDPAGMAAAILKLLEDEDARRQLGQQAGQFVQAHYSWQALVPRLERLYTDPHDGPA